MNTPILRAVGGSDNTPTNDGVTKPGAFSLDKFKSTREPAAAGVETLQTGLPHHNISAAKDYVRLHSDEDRYWSSELCFVSVPIHGQKHDTLHLIVEDLAMSYLASGRIQRFRLALATKPHDVFFLCHIPTRNMDNTWNASSLTACEQAKLQWVQATSQKDQGIEGYKIDLARDPDAFPEPKWPKQSLGDLIGATFRGRMIEDENHPALLRLIGARQSVS